MIEIPRRLRCNVEEDDNPRRHAWLATLPEQIAQLASRSSLVLGEPLLPGGQCAWVAPARDRTGRELVLKAGWRHPEAEHEGDALRLWDGDGAVRCLAEETLENTIALLLERCMPGTPLGSALPEPDQDVVLAALLRRLWDHHPPEDHPFQPLQAMCDDWADSFERDLDTDDRGLDLTLARDAITLLHELPRSADRAVLLCTDLHAENVLASHREPWLAIDPKPFIGDPAYDPVQHMLNCDERLATDPVGLARRMAQLMDLDPERVRLWLFARCAQESLHDLTMREPAYLLAP
ncbi:MAG: aminoglycoside phosphotransferase family protein [Actinomycetota bacterium]|nr:aminoglycoside phosphotransferase family protein [Actinomycetota bacterium]